MSTIALPEFMARTSLKKPLDQAATFVPRQSTVATASAGAVRHPHYRIRFASSSHQTENLPPVAQRSLRGHRGVLESAQQAELLRVAEGEQASPAQGQCRPKGFAPQSMSKTAGRGRLRLTRRGRLLFRGLPLLTLAALIVLGALTFAFPAQAKSSTSQPETPVSQTVTVYHGDSLWTIAQQVAPGQDSRDVINRIMQINDLTSAQVQPGQVLEVPVYSK